MKKIMTKVLSIVMAAAMCIGLVGTALAATTASTDTGTITISGVEAGLTVNAYKIAEAEYDNTGVGEFTGYKMLYTVADGFSIDQYGNYDESKLTEANLSALFTAAQAGSVSYTATADANGTATFTGMPVGAYLFVVTGSESTAYGMVIGSVYYATDENGNWKIVNGSVDVEGTNAWAKATQPTVTKVEKGGDQDDWTHGGTANVGDTLDYEITAGPIPNYEGAYPEFELIDTIDSKLEITKQEFADMIVKVVDEGGNETATLVSGTDYITTQTSDGFTIDFVVNGNYTLNSYVGQYIVVDFDADVIEAGDIDADNADHENDVTLVYATTSYVLKGDGTHYEGEDEDADYDYTFNAKILKTDQDEKALAGASFTLYTDENCATEYQQNGVTMTVTSGEDGYFEFTGLQAGTYYFKETTAPTGYALNTNIYKLVITATEKADGTIDTYTITVYNPDGSANGTNATVSQTDTAVMNTVLGTLPSMGGTGIALCVIAGCVVLGAAIAGVTVYRRKNNAEV